MDARNVFSHPNLEQTIRPINIVVDGSDKPQVWEERAMWANQRSRPGWEATTTTTTKATWTCYIVTSYEQAERNCHQGRRGGQRGAESKWRNKQRECAE